MIRSVPLSEDALLKAAEAIHRGEVVAYPTETLYGLGADATSPDSVNRVFELKRRRPDKPVPVIAADIDMTRELVVGIPPKAMKLIENFWPGPLTIMFDARRSLPEALTAGTGIVGIRVSSGQVAGSLVRMTNRAITATSANLSGAGDPADPRVITKDLGHGLAMLIDVGKLKEGPGSTVVDPRGDSLLILREGAIPAERLFKVWNAD